MRAYATLLVCVVVACLSANPVLSGRSLDRQRRVLVAGVREQGTLLPIQGAVVRVPGSRLVAVTDSAGLGWFPAKVAVSQSVVASCEGYRTATALPNAVGADTARAVLELAPTAASMIIGKVLDGVSMLPVVGARVWADDDTVSADSSGHFSLARWHLSPLDLDAASPGLAACARRYRRLGTGLVDVAILLYDSSSRCSLVGRAVDSRTGEGLQGVNIVLAGTDCGAASDMDGRYVVRGVPASDYLVECSHIGYMDERRRVVVAPQHSDCGEFRLEMLH